MNLRRKAFLTLVFSLMLFPCTLTFSENSSSVNQANRRTALRCLSIAKDYASSQNWQAAISQLTMAIAYDDTISDLWYLLAVCKQHDNSLRSEILPLVQKSLDINKWVDYNRDGARLLYADLLCDCGQYNQVPLILDAMPMIYSADAEFIRAKAYYRMGDPESVSKARRKIDSARKIFSDDLRFPLLFFMNESSEDENTEVRRLSEIFIQRIIQFVDASPDKNAELEVYACLFARGSTQERLLKSFSARHLRHPLYALAALKAGLMKEEQAFKYVQAFTDDSISHGFLCSFLPLVQDEKVKEKMKEYFDAYSGVILNDTDGDGIDNLYVKYSRGRPQTIFYDSNQDGTLEWSVACDFGLPVSGSLAARKMDFYWETFPYLKTVSFKGSNGDVKQTFNLVGETLKWTPLRIEPDEIISSASGSEFFFPVVNAEGKEISNQMLIDSSSSFIIPSEERQGATITFSVLNGKVEMAEYRAGERLYAKAEFSGNLPKLRVVDSDDDGVFETTEFYDVDSENKQEIHTLEDERLVMMSLFGLPSNGAEFYLRMVQVDTDGDTVPNFTEEYGSYGEKISSWDENGDGLWEIRYVRHSKLPGEKLKEEAMFYEQPGNNLVTVYSEDGKPVKVKSDGEELSVSLDVLYDFYWLGEPGTSMMARKALVELNSGLSQGVSTIVASENERVFCVRIGKNCFGISVPMEAVEMVEKEIGDEEN